jgi:2-methylcitrate dehydratase PrpD
MRVSLRAPRTAAARGHTSQLATYMAQARNMQLAPHVAQEAKHHVLDALAAIVSGSHLPAGEMAIHFARAQGGVAEATVLATDIEHLP